MFHVKQLINSFSWLLVLVGHLECDLFQDESKKGKFPYFMLKEHSIFPKKVFKNVSRETKTENKNDFPFFKF